MSVNLTSTGKVARREVDTQAENTLQQVVRESESCILQGKYKEALELNNHAIELLRHIGATTVASIPDLYLEKAGLFLKLGKYKEAIDSADDIMQCAVAGVSQTYKTALRVKCQAYIALEETLGILETTRELLPFYSSLESVEEALEVRLLRCRTFQQIQAEEGYDQEVNEIRKIFDRLEEASSYQQDGKADSTQQAMAKYCVASLYYTAASHFYKDGNCQLALSLIRRAIKYHSSSPHLGLEFKAQCYRIEATSNFGLFLREPDSSRLEAIEKSSLTELTILERLRSSLEADCNISDRHKLKARYFDCIHRLANVYQRFCDIQEGDIGRKKQAFDKLDYTIKKVDRDYAPTSIESLVVFSLKARACIAMKQFNEAITISESIRENVQKQMSAGIQYILTEDRNLIQPRLQKSIANLDHSKHREQGIIDYQLLHMFADSTLMIVKSKRNSSEHVLDKSYSPHFELEQIYLSFSIHRGITSKLNTDKLEDLDRREKDFIRFFSIQ